MSLPRSRFACCGIAAALLAVAGGSAWRFARDPSTPIEPEPRIVARVDVLDFDRQLVLFDTVFWEPDDTKSLRDVIRATPAVKGKDVLEIGTGSGLISLCCVRAGANRVVATDINPNAVANARHNAKRLGFTDRMEVRLVAKSDPGAYAVLKPGEKFDVIISNPPWEDRRPTTIDRYALDDEGFALLRSILKDLNARLKPGGRAFLAYGCVSAIKTLQKIAPEYGLDYAIYDSRKLDGLDEVFLPGMLVIVWPRDPDSSNAR
jgi:methylase of polypeptide subunit release factors